MNELTNGYKQLISGTVPDGSLLIPLLRWVSGSHRDIELCQKINMQIFYTKQKINILEVTLSNTVRHFIKYPKVLKDEPKTTFFYDDLAKYYGWSSHELKKNLSIIDIESIKPIIANAFGYTNKERKILKLSKLKR